MGWKGKGFCISHNKLSLSHCNCNPKGEDGVYRVDKKRVSSGLGTNNALKSLCRSVLSLNSSSCFSQSKWIGAGFKWIGEGF